MKTKIFFTLLLSLFVLFSYAQTGEDIVLTPEQIATVIDNSQMLEGNNFPNGTNSATISQTGNFNTATIQQNSTTGHNIGIIIQQGDNLTATLNQDGGGLDGKIVQEGAFHTSNLDMFGTDLDASIEQYGFGNMVEKTLQGTSKDFHIIQKGENLRFSIQGDMLPGMTIIQQGNGMQIEVR